MRGRISVRRSLRWLLVVAATSGFVATTAAPALADPAGPTNYESSIVAVEPEPTAATFEIVGGDAFLEVTVAPGHTLAVPGYFREPYIRIDADGSVWVNEDSKTLYENEDRYGVTEAPPEADGLGEPRWRRVADGGIYAWHDHRVHWMSRYAPPAVAGDTRQLVMPWRVPVVVDGTETVINGELFWVPSEPTWPLTLVGAVALVVVALAWRVRPNALGVIGVILAVGAGAAVIAQHVATPATARGFPTWIVFPAIAAIGAGLGATRRTVLGLSPDYLLLASGLTLAAWGFASADVVSMPIVPSAMPDTVLRTLVAIVGGGGFGMALLAVATVLGRTDRTSGAA